MDVWRKMCAVIWKKDPNQVYDKTRPQLDVKTDNGEDESSDIYDTTETLNQTVNDDTSTNGGYGDTEDHIDPNTTQERISTEVDYKLKQKKERESNSLPQRERKRRKIEDDKVKTVVSTDEENLRIERIKKDNCSSTESMDSESIKEERKKKSCRPKEKQKDRATDRDEVRTLKDKLESQNILLKNVTNEKENEIESLRKELDKLQIEVKEKEQEMIKKTANIKKVEIDNTETQTEKQTCRSSETQTPETGKLHDTRECIENKSEKGDKLDKEEKTEMEEVLEFTTPQMLDIGDLQESASAKKVEVQDPVVTSQIGTIPLTGPIINELKLKGVTVRPDGTFVMTAQFQTWVINSEIQVEAYQETPTRFPKEVQLDKTWHPNPSNLKLYYSYQGEWARMPKDRLDITGPLYQDYNIVRIEKYINA